MYEKYFKRGFDFIFSILAILILSPIILLLMAVGTIAMHGNPFFIQQRPGKFDKKTGEEKIFSLIKFRTMNNNKDQQGNLLPAEQRLNKYGRVLRSTSLDELPELFNILKGDMSFVGPRPLLIKYLPYYTNTERQRHKVRPGLTGLAQVNGRNAIDWDDKLAFDIEYINNFSFFQDVHIVLKTMIKVLKRSDINFVDNQNRKTFIEQREHIV